MNSLVTTPNGDKVYKGDTKNNFTSAEWLKLSIDQHLRLNEISDIPDKFKAEELRVIMSSVDEKEYTQMASITKQLSHKLILLGKFDEAVELCEKTLEKIDTSEKQAIGLTQLSLGKAHKKGGNTTEALNSFQDAIENIPESDTLNWIEAKKSLYRLNLMTSNTAPTDEEMDYLHEALKAMCIDQSNSTSEIDDWEISKSLESYYDLHSMILSNRGALQWAIRYSFAATVIAESRTGFMESTYSLSHLTKYLMDEKDFKSAKYLLSEKQQYLEQRGNTRGWVYYNLGRCSYGTGEFEDAIEHYLEAIECDTTDVKTTLLAHIGLSFAYKRTGDIEKANSEKAIAEKIAKESNFKPSWEEPSTNAEELEDTLQDQFVLHEKKYSWADSVVKARKVLGITNFEPVKVGEALWIKAKEIFTENQKIFLKDN